MRDMTLHRVFCILQMSMDNSRTYHKFTTLALTTAALELLHLRLSMDEKKANSEEIHDPVL